MSKTEINISELFKENIGGRPITAQGYKSTINYSDILTRLIKEAAECKSYSSDLWITWKYNVDQPLDDEELESKTVWFGFRELGVDHGEYIKHKVNEPESYGDYNKEYYSIWRLDIEEIPKQECYEYGKYYRFTFYQVFKGKDTPSEELYKKASKVIDEQNALLKRAMELLDKVTETK